MTEPYLISTNQFGEQYLPLINNNTFNTNGSEFVFQRQFKDQLWKECEFNIFIGTDSGLLVKYILKHGIPKNSRFVFIENKHVLDSIKELLPDITEHSQQLAICSEEDWDQKCYELEIDTYILAKKMFFNQSAAAHDSSITEYEGMIQPIRLALEQMTYAIDITSGGARFISQQLKNVAENTSPILLLKDKFPDKTAIILGGGPSLDEHMEWIKANQNSLVIICVSRLAKKLLQENLTPHMIFTVDPDEGSFDIGKQLLNFPEEVLFVYSNSGNEQLIAQWHGKSAYIGERFTWPSKQEKDNFIPHGPTVTNTASMTALDLGFKRVLLAGVDLCYSKEGYTHTKGTDEAAAGPFLSQDGQWVDTYAGHRALTDIMLAFAIKCFTEQAAHAKAHNIEVINLSKDAAVIENISFQDTSKIVLNDNKLPIKDIIANHIPDFNTQAAEADYQSILEEIKIINKDLSDIKKLCKEAIKHTEKMFSKDNEGNYNPKYKTQIQKIQNKLSKKYKSQVHLLQAFGSIYFTEFIKPAVTDNWNEQELEDSQRIYFEATLNSLKSFTDLTASISERTLDRLEELAPKPTFSVLKERWEKDKITGRARVWKKRHPEKYETFSAQEQKIIDQYITDFNQIITDEKTQWTERCEQSTHLNGVQAKADKLFNQGNMEGLSQLIEGLKLMSHDPDSTSLSDLCQAYIAAFNDKKEEALAIFKKVDEKHIKERALKTILLLSVDIMDADTAEDALKKLSAGSSAFTPNYAEILKLKQKYEESIFEYTQYLQEHDGDIPTWISLGKLYLEINEAEMAEMVFSHVLAVDPENQVVNALLAKAPA